jgi:hypothetical protein
MFVHSSYGNVTMCEDCHRKILSKLNGMSVSPICIEAIFHPSGQNKLNYKNVSGCRHWGESVTTHLYQETFLNVDMRGKRVAHYDLHY